MKKLTSLLISILLLIMLSGQVFASGVGNPSFMKPSGTAGLVPSTAYNELGQTGAGRWAKIWATDLDISGVFTFGGTMAGDLNMNNNLLLNIGAAGTDFTSGGGLNIFTDLDVVDNGTFGDIAIDEAAGVLDFTGATSGEIEVSTGNLTLDVAGDTVQTPDNKDYLAVNIPVSGTDAGAHMQTYQIDGLPFIYASATGDGAGGTGVITTNLGVSTGADVIHIGDANALLDLTDAHFSITEPGVISTLNATASTSTTTGSILSAGGIGIAGAINAGLGLVSGIDAAGGSPNTAGVFRSYSAGDNAFYNDFVSGTNTANASYTWPTAMPAVSGYSLIATDTGVMSWTVFPPEADTLQSVTSRGATTTTNVASTNATAFTAGEDVAGGSPNVAGQIKLFSAGDDAMYNTFTSGDNTANATYTLPVAMPAVSGYALTSTDAGIMSWAVFPAEADTLQSVASRGTTTTTSLTSTNATGLICGEDIAGGSPNVAGVLKLFSAGDNAYYSTLTAGTNTSNAAFILPVDEPAGTYLLSMTSGGQIGYDSSIYLTAEADTLDTVTGRGATTANVITIGGATFPDPGTNANSGILTLVADNATTPQTATIQTMYGADPYLRISAPNDAGTATAILDLKDQRVVIGAGTAATDYDIYFNAETNDGTITYMEDEDRFDFSGSVAIGEQTVLVPSADQARLDDSAVVCTNTLTRVVGSGGAVILDTDPAVADGSADGQLCIIQGTSDVNTVTIADNVNTQLAGGSSFVLADLNTLTLIWNSGSSTWAEQSRSAN